MAGGDETRDVKVDCLRLASCAAISALGMYVSIAQQMQRRTTTDMVLANGGVAGFVRGCVAKDDDVIEWMV